MDLYWLFFKTVVHTLLSLLSAAAVLFTSAAVPDRDVVRPHRAPLLLASLMLRAEAWPAAGGQSRLSLSARLQDNNPIERAKAACDAKKLGDGARPLMQELVAMLADDAAVPADVCGDWGRSFEGAQVQPTTPGEKAAAALVAVGTAAYDALEAALRVPQWFARRNAAWALGAMDDPRAVGPLRSVLRDPEPPVRRNAAWALGAIDDDEAVPALVAALKDSDAETRSNAAWALGAIGDERAVPELSKVVREDTEAKVRSQAAWALGAIGDARATPALAAALKDADVKVRRNAAWALGAIRN
jgi:HEAT repeat protein